MQEASCGIHVVIWSSTRESKQASLKDKLIITGNYQGFNAARSQEEKSYVWQHYVFPFAYPKVVMKLNEETKVPEQIVTYDPAITHGLLADDNAGRKNARNKLRYKEDIWVV